MWSFVLGGELRGINSTASLLVTIVVGWIFWVKLASLQHGLFLSILFGAILFGGVGFTVVFLGFSIVQPGENAGPLLGMITTGPLGLVLGGTSGFVYWFFKTRNTAAK